MLHIYHTGCLQRLSKLVSFKPPDLYRRSVCLIQLIHPELVHSKDLEYYISNWMYCNEDGHSRDLAHAGTWTNTTHLHACLCASLLTYVLTGLSVCMFSKLAVYLPAYLYMYLSYRWEITWLYSVLSDRLCQHLSRHIIKLGNTTVTCIKATIICVAGLQGW